MSKPRFIVADDHALLRMGVCALLGARFEVAGTFGDGNELVRAAGRLRPDLVVLGVSLSGLNGLDAATRISADLPAVKLVFLSTHRNLVFLRRAFAAGARAYVLKSGPAEELLEAVEAVLAGDRYISPGFGPDISLADLPGHSREATDLTGRQRQIVQLLAEGRMNKEIAHILKISIKTVDFHRARIMAKFGVHSSAGIVRAAMDQGLIA
jgi:DNA-binding NarL/FixJ family response regulator